MAYGKKRGEAAARNEEPGDIFIASKEGGPRLTTSCLDRQIARRSLILGRSGSEVPRKKEECRPCKNHRTALAGHVPVIVMTPESYAAIRLLGLRRSESVSFSFCSRKMRIP